MSTVAFIMSVYAGDRADWLAEALESMLNQEGTSVSVHVYLCADGPLTPELDQCLETFENQIYRILRFPENHGLAFALNQLIEYT